MLVQFNTTNFIPNYKKSNITQPKHEQNINNKEYMPSAYKDFSISFGERLFRTPENFYEQDFNEKNMPKSLHKYIYEGVDSNFKRTIPPAQAMKEVFGKIEDAKTLDEVKKMFPNEPLFKDLTSIPNKNSREGLLGMINLFKNDPDYVANNRTLFKNGKDDLGMYVLKKIYLEGKTLKEINKDFAKDVSVYYSGFDITYKDYSAFGIKFPEKSFWKSFIATREDFPYVYIPRNIGEKTKDTLSNKTPSKETQVVPPKKREPMSIVQRKKMSEIMINYHASMTPEQKSEWYKKLIAGMENSVVHNYFGEIVTIAQDRVGHADKMATFFEKMYGDPDYLQNAKTQKEKEQALSKFWKTHEYHKYNYSKAMSEVIAEFDKAYGETGENVEFKELLMLADSIAIKNEENRQIRAQARLEAQRQAEELKKAESISLEQENNVKPDANLSYSELVELEAKKRGAKVYRFQLPDGKDVSIVANLQEMLGQKLDEELAYMPTLFRNKYKKFCAEHPLATEKYLLSMFYAGGAGNVSQAVLQDSKLVDVEADTREFIKNEIKDNFMTFDEVCEVSKQIHREFDEKNNSLVRICNQAIAELITELEFPSYDTVKNLAEIKLDQYFQEAGVGQENLDTSREVLIENIINNVTEDLKHYHSPELFFYDSSYLCAGLCGFKNTENLSVKEKKFLDDRVNYYRQPLTQTEMKKISLAMIERLLKFDFDKNMNADDEKGIKYLCLALAETAKRQPRVRQTLLSTIQNKYISADLSDLRCFLDKNVNEKVLDAKIYNTYIELLQDHSDMIKVMASVDDVVLDKFVKPNDPELYNTLMKVRNLSGQNKMPYDIFNNRK